nr:pyridoxamine 5'-phosphate oxidase family protein [Gimesia panareensis]
MNVSPKGMDSFRVLGPNRVIWLNVTGSGNETSAHVQQDGRMTVMFCAFTGKPLILRLFGQARVIHPYDAEWDELFANFPPIPGARQVFDLNVDLVQTSCGMGVPFYDYVEEREHLTTWAAKQGPEGLQQYWHDKNQQSLDGIPTHILKDQ